MFFLVTWVQGESCESRVCTVQSARLARVLMEQGTGSCLLAGLRGLLAPGRVDLGRCQGKPAARTRGLGARSAEAGLLFQLERRARPCGKRSRLPGGLGEHAWFCWTVLLLGSPLDFSFSNRIICL